MMSAMDTPFGPKGKVALTDKLDSVVDVDNVGGPKIAIETKKDELMDIATEYMLL